MSHDELSLLLNSTFYCGIISMRLMIGVYIFAQTIKANLLKLFEEEGNNYILAAAILSREIKKKKINKLKSCFFFYLQVLSR